MRKIVFMICLLLLISFVACTKKNIETFDGSEVPAPSSGATPICVDGDTYISYYPNPEGNLFFPDDHSPSQELIDVRIAYFEEHACSGEKGGYFTKQDDVFREVSENEFNIFIKNYNDSCEGCLTGHFDGCC